MTNKTDVLTPVPDGDDYNIFDPSNFVTTTALNGKRAAIRPGAIFARRKYKDTDQESHTFLVITVDGPSLTQPRTNLIKTGANWPAIKDASGKLVRAESGPFLAGRVEKNSNVSTFLSNLKASGFDMAGMGSKGSAALDNAEITWKAVEKKISGEAKAYDVPAEFHGYVTADYFPARVQSENTAVEADASTAGVAPAGNGAVTAPVDPAVLEQQVIDAIGQAVAQHGEIPRGQLSIRVGPLLKDNPNKAQAFSLLMSDEVISKVPGVMYDKKTIKPVAVAAGA